MGEKTRRASAERRAHTRFPRTLEIRGAHSGGSPAIMSASDLSLGGLHCSSPADFKEMTRLAVTLMIPENGTTTPLDLEAVVVRRKEVLVKGTPRYHLALFFVGMAEDERERLAGYLAQSST